MRILGIETSCDETAVCLIEATGDFGPDFRFEILGNALTTQAALHARYGGVFPNLAKREHAKNLVPMLALALNYQGRYQGRSLVKEPASREYSDISLYAASLEQILEREPELYEQLRVFIAAHAKPVIDCIAVTAGPGLEPALWVGVNFAKALALLWDVPIVAVDHMEGHIVLSMTEGDHLAPFDFPVISLLISGGHTELVLSREPFSYERIGETRDDAAGEAFDKVARLLGLPYPGGPEISRLAHAARVQGLPLDSLDDSKGSPWTVRLPRPMIHDANYDFSFSGLKTAVRRLVEARQGPALPHAGLDEATKREIAREFEDAVADVLVAKTMRAADEYGAQTLVVGGGVSANTHIRERLSRTLADQGSLTKLLIPPPAFSTDNALMIALSGYFRALRKEFADPQTLRADGNLKLAP